MVVTAPVEFLIEILVHKRMRQMLPNEGPEDYANATLLWLHRLSDPETSSQYQFIRRDLDNNIGFPRTASFCAVHHTTGSSKMVFGKLRYMEDHFAKAREERISEGSKIVRNIKEVITHHRSILAECVHYQKDSGIRNPLYIEALARMNTYHRFPEEAERKSYHTYTHEKDFAIALDTSTFKFRQKCWSCMAIVNYRMPEDESIMIRTDITYFSKGTDNEHRAKGLCAEYNNHAGCMEFKAPWLEPKAVWVRKPQRYRPIDPKEKRDFKPVMTSDKPLGTPPKAPPGSRPLQVFRFWTEGEIDFYELSFKNSDIVEKLPAAIIDGMDPTVMKEIFAKRDRLPKQDTVYSIKDGIVRLQRQYTSKAESISLQEIEAREDVEWRRLQDAVRQYRG